MYPVGPYYYPPPHPMWGMPPSPPLWMGTVRTWTIALIFVSVVTVFLGTMILLSPSPIVAYFLLIASILTMIGCRSVLRYRAHVTVLVGPILLIFGFVVMLTMLFSFFTLISTIFLGIITFIGLATIWGHWDYLKAAEEWMGRDHPMRGPR